jgi:hypothetical protein
MMGSIGKDSAIIVQVTGILAQSTYARNEDRHGGYNEYADYVGSFQRRQVSPAMPGISSRLRRKVRTGRDLLPRTFEEPTTKQERLSALLLGLLFLLRQDSIRRDDIALVSVCSRASARHPIAIL